MTFAAVGCGGTEGPKPVRVSGIVEYNGKPLTGGSVTFNPADPQKGRVGQARIGEDGTFIPSTFHDKDGLLAGTYSVSVASTIPGSELHSKDKGTGVGGKSAIPQKYNSPKTSGIEETISVSDGGKVIRLVLKD